MDPGGRVMIEENCAPSRLRDVVGKIDSEAVESEQIVLNPDFKLVSRFWIVASSELRPRHFGC